MDRLEGLSQEEVAKNDPRGQANKVTIKTEKMCRADHSRQMSLPTLI